MMANTLAPMAGTIGMDTEDVEDLIRSGHFINLFPLAFLYKLMDYAGGQTDLN